MKTALFLILTATAAHAGGPVIVEDPTPVVAPRTEDGRMPAWVVPVGVGLIILAILTGGSTCNDEPLQPSPSGC